MKIKLFGVFVLSVLTGGCHVTSQSAAYRENTAYQITSSQDCGDGQKVSVELREIQSSGKTLFYCKRSAGHLFTFSPFTFDELFLVLNSSDIVKGKILKLADIPNISIAQAYICGQDHLTEGTITVVDVDARDITLLIDSPEMNARTESHYIKCKEKIRFSKAAAASKEKTANHSGFARKNSASNTQPQSR